MGARPLKRVFEEQIKKPLSKAIVFEEFADNNNGKIVVKYGDEGYYFE